METRKALRVQIYGRVQGVWFRGWTVEEAGALGLGGWVRNRLDGSVEALFSGPASAVDEMVKRCHSGPPSAAVASVVVEGATADPATGFTQKPTA